MIQLLIIWIFITILSINFEGGGNYIFIVSANEFSSNINVYNNILYDVRGVVSHILDADSNHDYNLCYVDVGGDCDSYYLDQVIDESNGVVAIESPLVDPENEDFGLTATSEARNVGADLGLAYSRDILGNLRDSSPDIGAYEYVS